eukprot:Sdes_comp10242_c0_seq1m1868
MNFQHISSFGKCSATKIYFGPTKSFLSVDSIRCCSSRSANNSGQESFKALKSSFRNSAKLQRASKFSFLNQTVEKKESLLLENQKAADISSAVKENSEEYIKNIQAAKSIVEKYFSSSTNDA